MEKRLEKLLSEARVYDFMKEGKTVGEIVKETGESRSKISHIVDKLKRYAAVAPLEEYFKMSSDLYPLIEKYGGKAEKILPTLMSALWYEGITSRGKLKMMSQAKVVEFCKGKMMRRAGFACGTALISYKDTLKKVKVGK